MLSTVPCSFLFNILYISYDKHNMQKHKYSIFPEQILRITHGTVVTIDMFPVILT